MLHKGQEKRRGYGKIFFAETLRHYDRIGLVKPCKADEWTGYRYYSQREIVRLETIRALRCMDLSLAEIKEILS